jgi:WD40 repeat protein
MNDYEAPLMMVHTWWEVWDLETARPLVRLKGQELRTQGGAAVSPDGRRVVGGSAVAFSPDGRTIAAAVNDGSIWLWDSATGERTGVLEGAPGGTFRLGFSRDGSRILSYGPQALLAWDVATRVCLAVLRDPPGGLWSPKADEVFLLNGTFLSLKPRKEPDPGHGNDVRVWDPQTGKCLLTIPGAHDQLVCSVEISPDGKQLLSTGGDSSAKLWDAGTGRRIAVFAEKEFAHGAVFSPDGRRILTHSPQCVVLWDAETRKPLHRFDGEGRDASFSADGKRILCITGVHARTLQLWDAATFKTLKTIEMPEGVDQINSATISPDGRHILTANGLDARIWSIETGKEVVSPMSPNSGLVHAVYAPDGLRIVIANYNSHRVYVMTRKAFPSANDGSRGPAGSRDETRTVR